jgi:hypothetical protein
VVLQEGDSSSSKLSDSEYSFEGSSLDYTRTLKMKNNIKRSPNYNSSYNILNVKGKGYVVISSKTRNFFEYPIASCGAKREVILLDPANSHLLNKHFAMILKLIESNIDKIQRMEQTLQIVCRYVRKKIFAVACELTSLENKTLLLQKNRTMQP